MHAKSIDIDSQPEKLVDKLLEANYSTVKSYSELSVLFSGERLYYRKVELVLRYHVPNKLKDSEGYAHDLLFMFYPCRDDGELKVGQPQSYTPKLSKPGVLKIINDNKCMVKCYSDLANDVFLSYRVDIDGNKTKGRISKRVFQESKARQIFRKTNISYPPKSLSCFAFLKHPF